MYNNIPEKIKIFNGGRLPELLKRKYGLMRADEYHFLRAIPNLFYEDILSHSFLCAAPNVWLCGDLHLENMGSYKGDDRLAYFNINDFDECILGSFLLDICRMLTSIYIASYNLDISMQNARKLCAVFINTYFDKLEEGYIRVLEQETTRGAIKGLLEQVQKRKRKVFLKKRTEKKKGKLKLLIDNKHTLPLLQQVKDEVAQHIYKWAKGTWDPDFYKVKDVAFRIAGTSSLGLNRYIVLIEGRKTPGGNFFLDLKETLPPCSAKYTTVKQPVWKHEAERIVEVQKRILSAPPALLGSIDIGKKNFVLKELQLTADRIDYTLFSGNVKKLQHILEDMACVCAWSNLRSSGRQGSAIADELIHFAKTERKMIKKVADYAYAYTKTINSYYKSYCAAYDKGFFNK